MSVNIFRIGRRPDTHKAGTLANGGGKRIEDIYGRDKPFSDFIIATLGLSECGDLFSKDSEDCIRGIAGLESGK
jgi:hypothetical protein